MNFGDFFRHITLVFVSYLGLLGIPMPLPLPPQPEDPAMLRVAPADSVLFVQWFGQGESNPNSKNRCEQLAQEPEVRAMITRLIASCRAALVHESRGSEDFAAVLALLDSAVTMFAHPGCLFVQDLQPFAGGFVVRNGEQAAATAKAFAAALVAGSRGRAQLEKKTIGDVTFETVALPQDLKFLAWGVVDNCFVLSVGEAATEQIVAGLQNTDQGLAGNPGVRRLMPGCKVERPVLRTYASIEKILRQAPYADKFWRPLGLSATKAALAESGLEGDGFVSRVQLAIPQPLEGTGEGLLGQLRGKPLSQDDLALIPGDATTAIAMRSIEGGLERAGLLAATSMAGQDPSPLWERFLAEGIRAMGLDIRKDLLSHLDDCVVTWNSPGQGGLGFTGAVASLPLRDAQAFGENLTMMWHRLAEIAPSKEKARAKKERLRPYGGYLGSFEHGGSKVWWMDHVDRDLPFGISWTSTDQHGLFSMQPQQIRTAIDNSTLPNFDTALVRKPLIARRGDAHAMLYVDLQGLLRQGYGALLVMFQMESHQWQNDGFDFELADVPRLESLARHLGPELTVLEAVPNGWRITRRGSLPVLDPLLVTVATACLLMLD